MHERIRFIDYLGKKILLVDLSNCPVNQVEEVVRKVPDYITVQPLGSVMVLTDFTGATFDRDAIRTIKETAVLDKPFVRKSALVGIEGITTVRLNVEENQLVNVFGEFGICLGGLKSA